MSPVPQKPLFITGMFRSGTTLTARMLHAHPHIAVAGDGLFPFFKYLRNRIAQAAGILLPPDFDLPLHDYYFDGELRLLFESIQKADFDYSLESGDLDRLKKSIKSGCTAKDQYAPRLEPFVHELQGLTYREAWLGLQRMIVRAYAHEDTVWAGPKEVWTGEFLPALYRSFPDTHFIYVIRDPRAVIASKTTRTAKYPWLFLARQWRKLAGLGLLYSGVNGDFNDRVFLLRFEDLIRQPEQATGKVCEFLSLDWDESMVTPHRFVDGLGNPWRQNTAYNIQSEKGFDRATISRWEAILGEAEVRFIEYLCGPEMSALGYPLKYASNPEAERQILMDPPRLADGDLASWISRFVDNSFEGLVLEMGRERLRHDLLAGADRLDRRHARLLDLCFLDHRIFEDVRGASNPMNNDLPTYKTA